MGIVQVQGTQPSHVRSRARQTFRHSRPVFVSKHALSSGHRKDVEMRHRARHPIPMSLQVHPPMRLRSSTTCMRVSTARLLVLAQSFIRNHKSPLTNLLRPAGWPQLRRAWVVFVSTCVLLKELLPLLVFKEVERQPEGDQGRGRLGPRCIARTYNQAQK
eukprot:2773787-Pleurochrysis_carterae.AAC.3